MVTANRCCPDGDRVEWFDQPDQIGNHFYLYDSTGAGPSLKFQGADYVPGQFGAAVVPIGAEADGQRI